MFQRLKGAIDTRIAEEQARQRQATQAAAGRQPVRPRPRNQNGTSGRSPAGPRVALSNERGPDPTEFETDLNEDGDIAKQSTGEPDNREIKSEAIGETENDTKARTSTDETAQASISEGQSEDATISNASINRNQELPAEIRVKLRKLERLEGKYGELLKAYRIAHARVQVIEPFETSLRENTPLTSIVDPTALVEYLNQVKVKGDMVLEEFKKVSSDRDEYKKKFEQSEHDAAELRTELQKAKEAVHSDPITNDDRSNMTAGQDSKPAEEARSNEQETEGSIKSPASTASRIPSISLFSPRFGGKKEEVKEEPKKVSEDLFSYDSELPRLETELQERSEEVVELRKQLESLKGDLKVARESTEGMVQTLETSSHELNTLRETNDKLEAANVELEGRVEEMTKTKSTNSNSIQDLQRQISELQQQYDEAKVTSRKLEDQIQDLKSEKTQFQSQLETQIANADIINQKLSQKDAIVKDLEDSLAMAKQSEREQSQPDESSEKKIATMRNIMESVRTQLSNAESTVTSLKREIQANQDEFSKKPSTKIFGFLDEETTSGVDNFNTRDDAIDYLASNFGLQRASQLPDHNSVITTSSPATANTVAAKKKNKKKKKTGKGVQDVNEDVEPDIPVKVSEDLSEQLSPQEQAACDEAIGSIRDEIGKLTASLHEKSNTIERLTKQIKDQEALQEEVETLRDDLLHQGQEHVEARELLRVAQNERKALQDSVNTLEKELSTARDQIQTHTVVEKEHEELINEHKELQNKISTAEKDLKIAESLATARFKDISDLKDLLAKAQPELRNLRSEVAELKSVKEDLKNKQGELNRLESRHEDLKAEMKGLGKRLGEKDAETKILQEKIEQETKARSRVEEDLNTKQSDLRVAEKRRSELSEQLSSTSQDLTKAKEDLKSLRSHVRDLEEQISGRAREAASLREEVALKTALHSSSQSLLQSLRDQMHELSTQAREATARADSLEDELAEAQRMLTERTQQSETMRTLISKAENGTESRIREMKERMDVAIEERDRVEDEASVANRRMMREVEDAKSKARDTQRQFKILEDEKDELEGKLRDWRRRREDLERNAEASSKELEDLRNAVKGLREALDESERQIREAETQKTELRRQGEETSERVEKLTRANKNLTEEIKNIQHGAIRKGNLRPAGTTGGLDSGLQSSRTSTDSSSARPLTPARAISRNETPTNTNNNQNVGLSQGTVDYVYLKNVLLQFMERKDKSHQRQLIPVLSMLLHFDQNDEQKWMSAISAK